jgi:hypothetical protein
MSAGMLVQLDRRLPRFKGSGAITAVARSRPFIEAGVGEYTHRVRSANLHTICGQTHLNVRCWCGMHLNIGRGTTRRTRLVAEPTGRPVCATCEGRAIGAGLCGAREIAGRPVMFRGRR